MNAGQKPLFVIQSRYNRWVNHRLYTVYEGVPDEQRKQDMGAFFRSIHGTLNHLLLGDLVEYSQKPQKEQKGYQQVKEITPRVDHCAACVRPSTHRPKRMMNSREIASVSAGVEGHMISMNLNTHEEMPCSIQYIAAPGAVQCQAPRWEACRNNVMPSRQRRRKNDHDPTDKQRVHRCHRKDADLPC